MLVNSGFTAYTSGIRCAAMEDTVRICEEIGMEKLGNPVVVDIQNIVDYMYQQQEDIGKAWNSDTDFPTWLSPWDLVVYEFCLYDDSYHKTAQISVLATTTKNGEDGFTMCTRILSRNRGTMKLHGGTEIILDPNGFRSEQDIRILTSEDIVNKYDSVDAYQGHIWGLQAPVLLANSFLACKNVATHDVKPHPKLAKAQMKKRGVPKVTYKVLDIGPAKEILRTKGDVEHNGLQKALHICRGHFAHYGPEAPLFGKYTGAFWHPMHMRGSAKNGIVVKDYRVKAEEPCTTTTNAKTVATGPALTT